MFKKKLNNNTFGLQFFMLGRFAGTIVITIFLAKSVFWLENPVSMQDIGRYEMFLFIAGLISFLFLNALVRGLLGFTDINNKQSVNHNVTQVFYVFIFLSIIFSGVLLGLNISFSILSSTVKITLLAAIFAIFWTPSTILEYTYTLRKEALPLYLSGIITPFLQILFGIAGTLLTQSIEGTIYGITLVAVLRFFTTAIILFSEKIYKPDFKFIKRFLIFSSPLVLSAIINESSIYIDGLIVDTLFDERTFAIFRYGAREIPVVSIMALGLSNAMIPLFASLSNRQKHLQELKIKTKRLYIWLVPFTIVFLICSNWLYINVFNAEFIESAIIFDIYLITIIPRLIVPQTIIIGSKQNRLMIIVSIVEITVKIGLSIWFGIIWGIFGIALATLIANIIEKICMIYLTKKYIGIQYSAYIPRFTFLISTLLVVGVFILKHTLFK